MKSNAMSKRKIKKTKRYLFPGSIDDDGDNDNNHKGSFYFINITFIKQYTRIL